MIKETIIGLLLMTANAESLPDVIESTNDDSNINSEVYIDEASQEKHSDLITSTSDNDKGYEFTMVILPNINKSELVSEFNTNVDLTTSNLSVEAKKSFIDQLVEKYDHYKLDKISWSDKFHNVKGTYINSDSEEIVAGASEGQLYISGTPYKIGDITPATDNLSVIIFDNKSSPLFTYNYARDTITNKDGDVIYTNTDRDYVYTEGVYVNKKGVVMVLTKTEMYVNGKLINKIASKNLRPRELGGTEGEWIMSNGDKLPFIFQDGKILTPDDLWFLLL